MDSQYCGLHRILKKYHYMQDAVLVRLSDRGKHEGGKMRESGGRE